MGLSIGPTIGVDGAEKFQLAFKEMAASAGALQSKMDAVTASFRETDSAMSKNKQISEQLKAQIEQQTAIYNKATDGVDKARQAIVDAAQAVEQSKKEYEASEPVLQIFYKNLEDANKALESQTKIVENAQKNYDSLNADIKSIDQSYQKMRKPILDAKEAQDKLTKEAQEKLKVAKERAKELSDAYGRMSPQAKGAREAVKQLTQEYQDQKQKSKVLKDQLDELAKEYGQNTKEYKELTAMRRSAKATLEDEKKALKEATRDQKAHEHALNGAKREYDALEKSIGTAEKRLAVAKVTFQKWTDVAYTAKAKLEEFKKALADLPNKLGSFGQDLEKFGGDVEEFGEKVSTALAPFTALSTFAIKGASDFTDALAKISTIADTSKVSLDEFGTGIQKLASETGFATDDIAAAVYQALSAAVSTEDALEFTAGAADLARAGFLDMFGSVDVLTTILNAYHKDVSEVSHISDVLVKVQDRGKTTVNELAASMGNVIPTAAQYGISLEDLGAAYVVLTKQGINTARTTIYLRSAFTELEKAESDSSKALQAATGKTFMQLMKEGKSLGEIMQILKDSVGGNEEAFIHLFGSIRTAAGALALANTSAYEYAEILDDVSNSNGQAARNVQKLQTPSLKMKKIWEQLKTSGIDLGQEMLKMLMPALEKVAKFVKSATDRFKNLKDSSKAAIGVFVGIAGSIGPVLVVGGKLLKWAGKFISIFAKVIAGVGTFSNVLTVAGVVIAGLVAWGTKWSIVLNEEREAAEAARRAEWGLTDAQQERIDRNKELIEQSNQVYTATWESVHASEAEARTAQSLLRQLRELYDENGKVLKGKEAQAEFIKGALADALGIEIGELDKQIEKYGILSGEIDNLVQKKLKEAKAQAYLEGYTKQIQIMGELQAESEKAYKSFEEQDKKRADAMDLATKKFDEFKQAQDKGLTGDALKPYTDAWADAHANYLIASEDLDKARQDYLNLGGALEEGAEKTDFFMTEFMKATGMTEEEAKKSLEESGGALKEFSLAHKKEFDKIAQQSQEGMDAYNQAIIDAKTPAVDNSWKLAHESLEALRKGQSGSDKIGEDFAQGFINGILGKVGEAGMAGTLLGNAAANKTREAGKTSSPSKVMAEIGGYYGEGFVNGMAGWLSSASAMGSMLGSAAFPDTSWTSNYSRLPEYAYGTTNNTRNISAPIAVNVNVNGNVDDPNGLADIIEQRLVEKIINNERAFA